MCDIELKEDIGNLMRDTMIGVLSGDINPLDVLVELQKIGKSIPDILFYKNIECMLNGLDKKGTIKRKVGKIGKSTRLNSSHRSQSRMPSSA